MKCNSQWALNQRVERVTTDTLVVGIDIAKDFHVAQAATCRGVVLSRHALRVSNSAEGFAHLLEAVRQWQATYQLSEVIVGMESTGHYWLNLAHWLADHGLEVVLVNPATTKRNKENRDNSPAKNDPKDAAVIADLVGRGYYAPYQFPAPIFARLQVLVKARERLVGDGTRLQNRLHGWLDVWFPEYASVFGDLVSPRSLATLHRFPTPADLHGLSLDQVVEGWRDQGMARPGGAVGRRVAQALLTAARGSIGNAQALVEAKAELGWLLQQYDALRAQQTVFEDQITALLPEVPGADVLPSVGLSPLQCGTLLGYAGDLSRFDHGNQLLRLAGMNLITSQSGKSQGKVTLSKRGSAPLRKVLYLSALSLIHHAPTFRAWHQHHVQDQGLTGMASLMKLIGKLARILVALVRTHTPFAPPAAQIMASASSRRPENTQGISPLHPNARRVAGPARGC